MNTRMPNGLPIDDPAPRARVAVIIAAHDAARTIAGAVASALSQDETAEVVVVDDASSDGTADAALSASSGDARLRILRTTRNLGPAAARNLGIASTSAPFIAVLDADDVILPGRFEDLLKRSGWDLIADNIVFLPDDEDLGQLAPKDRQATGLSALDLAGFALGNLAGKGGTRGELGFLKPVMRRDFLDRCSLRYDEGLRLGEDYDLYTRAMLCGARFLVAHRTGYAARVRADSLSGRHRTADLAALEAATRRHLEAVGPDHAARPVLTRLHLEVAARHRLRVFLDRKAERGAGAALRFAVSPPSNLWPIARGVMRDKLAARTGQPPPKQTARYLLAPIPEAPRADSPSRA
jgi:succinoglycan biosynthesis protein ExoU